MIRLARSTASGPFKSTLIVAASFSRNFVGPGRYEIVDVPGGIAFRSVFDGVRRKGFTRFFWRALWWRSICERNGENAVPVSEDDRLCEPRRVTLNPDAGVLRDCCPAP
jgi:hypothetical protein